MGPTGIPRPISDTRSPELIALKQSLARTAHLCVSKVPRRATCRRPRPSVRVPRTADDQAAQPWRTSISRRAIKYVPPSLARCRLATASRRERSNARRWRSRMCRQTMELTLPISSSKVTKMTPLSVSGTWRMVTMPQDQAVEPDALFDVHHLLRDCAREVCPRPTLVLANSRRGQRSGQGANMACKVCSAEANVAGRRAPSRLTKRTRSSVRI